MTTGIQCDCKYNDVTETPSMMCIEAARHNNVRCMEWAIREGADMTAYSGFGNYTAAMYAAENGNFEGVRACLNTNKVDLMQTTAFGFTAPMLALLSENVKCLELFLETNEVDMNQRSRQDDRTITMLAIGFTEVGFYLCMKTCKVDLNLADSMGNTIPMMAISHGYPDYLQCCFKTDQVDLRPVTAFAERINLDHYPEERIRCRQLCKRAERRQRQWARMTVLTMSLRATRDKGTFRYSILPLIGEIFKLM